MDKFPETTVRSTTKADRPFPVDLPDEIELEPPPGEPRPANLAERLENWGSD